MGDFLRLLRQSYSLCSPRCSSVFTTLTRHPSRQKCRSIARSKSGFSKIFYRKHVFDSCYKEI